MQSRRAYPSDVSDEEWALVAPYLTLLPETAAQREHSLRGVQRAALRGAIRRGLACDAPRSAALARRARSSPTLAEGGLLRDLVHDLRAVLRLASAGPRNLRPWSSTAGRCARRRRVGPRAACDGHKRTRVRNCTRPSIRSGRCGRCTSRPPMPMTAPPWPHWLMPCRRRPATEWISPTSIQGYTRLHDAVKIAQPGLGMRAGA